MRASNTSNGSGRSVTATRVGSRRLTRGTLRAQWPKVTNRSRPPLQSGNARVDFPHATGSQSDESNGTNDDQTDDHVPDRRHARKQKPPIPGGFFMELAGLE